MIWVYLSTYLLGIPFAWRASYVTNMDAELDERATAEKRHSERLAEYEKKQAARLDRIRRGYYGADHPIKPKKREDATKPEIARWALLVAFFWPAVVTWEFARSGWRAVLSLVTRPTAKERLLAADAASAELSTEAEGLGLPTVGSVAAEIDRAVQAEADKLLAAAKKSLPPPEIPLGSSPAMELLRQCAAARHQLINSTSFDPMGAILPHVRCATCGNEYICVNRDGALVPSAFKKGS